MALSNILSAAGHTRSRCARTRASSCANIDGAPTLARIDLDVEGQVANVDQQQFQAYADEAKRVCPVSRALAGIPEIALTAKLAGNV